MGGTTVSHRKGSIRARLPRGPRDLAALSGALLAWSLIPLTMVAVRVALNGGEMTWADAHEPQDSFQYFAWIRDAGEHVLIANRFDIAPAAHVFLHPMLLVSGVLWRLGTPLGLSYALWKPVAAVALAAGALAYVRRLGASRWVAALGLFALAPVGAIPERLDLHVPGINRWSGFLAEQMTPLHSLWGYLPSAIAIGLMPFFLLGAEQLVNAGSTPLRRSRAAHVLGLSAIGLTVAWLHPWQGLVLVLVVGGAALWGRLERRYFALAVPVAATLVPIAYYFVLQHTNDIWHNAGHVTGFHGYHALELIVVLGPFLVLAAFGVRRPVQDLQERMLLLWPAAALVTFAITAGGRYHAFGGIALPLAVLCTRAWRRLELPRAATLAAAALMVVPGTLFLSSDIGLNIRDRTRVFWLYPRESAAMDYLSSAPHPGGILSSYHISPAAVAMTGRQAWVGNPIWTPDYLDRAARTAKLFAGTLPARDARRLVAASGARYVLADCPARDPARALGPMVLDVKRFGCVSVIEVRTSPG
jgi:hypothetical protein